jgi:hypothetical protein
VVVVVVVLGVGVDAIGAGAGRAVEGLEGLLVAGAKLIVRARVGNGERHGVQRRADGIEFAPHIAGVLVDVRHAARQPFDDLPLDVHAKFVARWADEVAVDPHEAAAADRARNAPSSCGPSSSRLPFRVVEPVTQPRAAHRVLLVGERVGGIESRLPGVHFQHRAVVAGQVVRQSRCVVRRSWCPPPCGLRPSPARRRHDSAHRSSWPAAGGRSVGTAAPASRRGRFDAQPRFR